MTTRKLQDLPNGAVRTSTPGVLGGIPKFNANVGTNKVLIDSGGGDLINAPNLTFSANNLVTGSFNGVSLTTAGAGENILSDDGNYIPIPEGGTWERELIGAELTDQIPSGQGSGNEVQMLFGGLQTSTNANIDASGTITFTPIDPTWFLFEIRLRTGRQTVTSIANLIFYTEYFDGTSTTVETLTTITLDDNSNYQTLSFTLGGTFKNGDTLKVFMVRDAAGFSQDDGDIRAYTPSTDVSTNLGVGITPSSCFDLYRYDLGTSGASNVIEISESILASAGDTLIKTFATSEGAGIELRLTANKQLSIKNNTGSSIFPYYQSNFVIDNLVAPLKQWPTYVPGFLVGLDDGDTAYFSTNLSITVENTALNVNARSDSQQLSVTISFGLPDITHTYELKLKNWCIEKSVLENVITGTITRYDF